MPGKCKQYSETLWMQALWPISRKEDGAIAQHGRSVISTIASFASVGILKHCEQINTKMQILRPI